MEKEFVPYQPSLDMKELGFNEPCFALFKNGKFRFEVKDCNSIVDFYNRSGKTISCLAPTFSQCFRWFRVKKIHLTIQEYDINNYMFSIDDGINPDIEIIGFNSYEEAELECLVKLIDIVKKQNLKG